MLYEVITKKPLLFAMLEQTATGRVLIFTRTKHRAKDLATVLQKRKYRVSALQGNMSQNRRQDAITGFRSGKYDILVVITSYSIHYTKLYESLLPAHRA